MSQRLVLNAPEVDICKLSGLYDYQSSDKTPIKKETMYMYYGIINSHRVDETSHEYIDFSWSPPGNNMRKAVGSSTSSKIA